MKSLEGEKLTLWRLVSVFRGRVLITWSLSLVEVSLIAGVPLLVGLSIDGLLASNTAPFLWLASGLAALLVTSVLRRVYDTRVYGGIRVRLGEAIAARRQQTEVSRTTAQLTMSRELTTFLEDDVPAVLQAVVSLAFALGYLYIFDPLLALSAGIAGLLSLATYGLLSKRIFRLNAALNSQNERQVSVLRGGIKAALSTHLGTLKRHEVRLSDTEALIYGCIFFWLLAMLLFNLWHSANSLDATPGQIFTIVTYSYEFLESAVVLPVALQNLTRTSEITQRIN